MYENRTGALRLPLLNMGLYAGLTVVTTVGVSLALRQCLRDIMSTVPLDYFLRMEGVKFSEIRVTDMGTTLVVSALLGAAIAAWGLFMHYIHVSKVMNR